MPAALRKRPGCVIGWHGEVHVPAELRDKPEIELFDGRRYPKVSPKRTHGMVQLAMAMILVRCVGDRGDTATEWRCRLEPQTEFVPDVAFVSFERLRPLS